MSDAEMVREFTEGAGQPAPNRPERMTREEVDFLGKMIIDELLELYSTVMPPEEAKASITRHVETAKVLPQATFGDDVEAAAEQADALVDIYYYSLNAAAKKGVNLSSIFHVVHQANMNKRDPATKKFIIREDGKIMKPAGWMPPDVVAEVRRQAAEGSFEPLGSAASEER